MVTVWVLCFLLAACNASQEEGRMFPDDFLFGTATASYQIEGGWNADDKSESIWDRLVHTNPSIIADLSNGDIAADTYHNYKRDVEMMRELGVNSYRFSLSWPRILPNGIANEVSEAGVTFYNNYINEMIKYNITPMATLYHWDMPQKLQDLGGFTNPLFAEWFEDYARVAYKSFGDRVKFWITFNEPYQICYLGYGYVLLSPMLNISDVGTYYCVKNLLIAHARAYHAYVDDFQASQGGVCGITINVSKFAPLTDSKEDEFATEIKRQGDWGLYAEPIYSKEGGYPKELSEIIAKKSAEQGYPRSRLPEFTEEEQEYVRGTYDFFGVNHYASCLVSATQYKMNRTGISLYSDMDVGTYLPPEWPVSASGWLTLSPNSLYDTLSYLHKKYDGVTMYVTENGWSTSPGAGLEDNDRVAYYRAAWESLLDALEEGVNVKGYMAWSLMDNFEWTQGSTQQFGLYEVDFASPARTRTPRKSAFVYKRLLRARTVEHDYEPPMATMTIDDGH